MNKLHVGALLGLLLLTAPSTIGARQWSLDDCIRYALDNNITIQKNRLNKLSAHEDVLQSKAALLPSLSANMEHDVAYSPWLSSGTPTVANGFVQSSVSKVYYNGNYSVSANWTVWNGNRNTNTIKLNKVLEQQAGLDSAITANTVLTQIAQLYVQVLYLKDAIEVNKQSLEASKTNERRGQEMVSVGQMSKADLAQLTAQRAQDEYNVVAAESNVQDYKRQLKQLLQITSEEEFDVTVIESTDDMALKEIPTLTSVYEAALETRPEIKNAKLGIDGSDINIKLAKAQNLPTIGVGASAGTNTTTMSSTAWGKQLKTNFDVGAGVSVSIPIFDNRSKRTALNKARLQKQSYMLDLQEQQTTLYSDIENYWLQANTNQNQFKAAKVSVESAQMSYDLLSEQFKLGLKNIVELMTGKVNLVTAQQGELQSKYLAILNIQLLDFYQYGGLR